jgi:F0F1-type ATP synthase assembly protein I
MDQEEHTPTGQKPSNSYLRYGNFALQLFGGMALAGWAGYRLDKYLAFKFPAFLLSFVLIVFGVMLYQIYKKLNKE